MPSPRLLRLKRLAALAATGALLSLPAYAQSSRAGDAPIQQKLAQRATLSWHCQSLGPALARLRESQAIPLWIDRRIDVAAPLELEIRDAPLGDALNQLAAVQQAKAVLFRGIVYFGPASAADELATLAARVKLTIDKLPTERRKKWLTPAPWSFPRLSQPRELVERLAADAGAKVVDADRIPHDLWEGQELPPLSPLDRAVLLLVGFDLTCELAADGGTLRIVPIQRPVTIERRYAPTTPRRAAFDAAVAAAPDAVVQWNGLQATVSAREEVHEQLRNALAGRPALSAQSSTKTSPPQKPSSRQAFTLKIDNRPVGAVLDQLAQKLNVEIVWADAVSPEARAATTSCDVRNATLDELLTALLKPAGLAFERTEGKIEIRLQ